MAEKPTLMGETLCIRVPIKQGEQARQALLDMGLLSHEYRIKTLDDSLLIPVERPPTTQELRGIPGGEVVEAELEPARKRETVEDILGFSPTYEMIGDIAIVGADDPRARDIAHAIIQVHKNIETVLEPTTPVSGEHRTREYKVLAGEPRTTTTHKEYGLQFKIDLERAYFSPRLATERKRIADQIEPGDIVVDMFTGVGPFALLAAQHAEKVVAIDINPTAIELLRENLKLNDIGNVEVVQADVREVYEEYGGTADHVIMNLPHTAQEFLPEAIAIAKQGGVIHYYDIRPEDDLYSQAIENIEAVAGEAGHAVEVLDMRVVRSYAPYQYNIAIDFRAL